MRLSAGALGVVAVVGAVLSGKCRRPRVVRRWLATCVMRIMFGLGGWFSNSYKRRMSAMSAALTKDEDNPPQQGVCFVGSSTFTFWGGLLMLLLLLLHRVAHCSAPIGCFCSAVVVVLIHVGL